MDYPKLKQLLIDQGIADTVPSDEAAALLNGTMVMIYRILDSSEVLTWSAMYPDDVEALEADAADLTSTTKGYSRAALKLLSDSGRHLDMGDPANQAMVDGLTAAGVLSTEGRAALYGMAAQQVSVAEAAGQGALEGKHIDRARA